MKDEFQVLYSVWNKLYTNSNISLLDSFCDELIEIKKNTLLRPLDKLWYKNAVVYSLYVDRFNVDFFGLADKLDYLHSLGVNCLWLLPILNSPMKDAGFDVSNYRKIRKSLFSLSINDPNETYELFTKFVDEVHKRNISIIFDMVFNHCSNEHDWFINACQGKDNFYRNYFIWSDDAAKYSNARIIFKGLCDSNWTKLGEQYYFHRFFEFQPDLNYRNPQVLLEMIRNLLYWLKSGVDGFRADAIPYLWKEDDTDCENLDGTHELLKFIRFVIDYIHPGVLLLAEACQKPIELVKYIGSGDECNGGYNFPLMPMIFKSIAIHDNKPIINVLDNRTTPNICADSQWFTFLRCHDELSLEDVYVSESDRKIIYDEYCRKSLWNFRQGEGISARLSELMNFDADKILLAFSMVLSLPGTPVIYYGDEFGMPNDEECYKREIEITGENDSRFLVRGCVNWHWIDDKLADSKSFNSKVFNGVKSMISQRVRSDLFENEKIEWVDCHNDGILAYYRWNNDNKILIVNNLTDKAQTVAIPQNNERVELERFNNKWIWIK